MENTKNMRKTKTTKQDDRYFRFTIRKASKPKNHLDSGFRDTEKALTEPDLKVGLRIRKPVNDDYVVTKVFSSGRFEAVVDSVWNKNKKDFGDAVNSFSVSTW